MKMRHSKEENSRQALIKDWNQEKISSKSVLIGGCGADGSITAMKLARLGVGKIIAVDPDILEKHNLENQMYTEKDLGKPKVLALKRIVNGIDKEIKIESYKKKIEDSPDNAWEADYYLSCFDNVTARFYMNKCAILDSKPLIDAGIEGFTGTVRTIIPEKTPCLECWPSLIPEPKLEQSCSRDPIPSTFITASHASDLQVMQLIKLIFGWKIEPYLYFDLRTNICNSIPLDANPKCMSCGADMYGQEGL
jgi:molybdopterin/thiamine biosynthesis adenylyltransferase